MLLSYLSKVSTKITHYIQILLVSMAQWRAITVKHDFLKIITCFVFDCMLKSDHNTMEKKTNKQEAHGTHRSPENQFQSINTFAHD